MRAWWIGFTLWAASACTADADHARQQVADLAVASPDPRFSSSARFLESDGGGVLKYLGLDVEPPDPKAGQTITLTHYWGVDHPAQSAASVSVAGVRAGRTVVSDTHAPLYGRLPISEWRPGDVWADRHAVRLPDDLSGGPLDLRVRLGERRWTIEAAPGAQDGNDGLFAGRVTVRGPAAAPSDGLPTVEIPRADGPIVADGLLDEADWARAPVLTFSDSLGRNVEIRHATRLRLLYDATYLYVGFEADDIDITERYRRRDDPIYEHETVELFLMPNVAAPATGPYVELQASPGGVIFDASFDGPRQGMNKGFNANQTVGTRIDGTLNDPAPDQGWVSEWRVAFRDLRGVRRSPKPGDEWRMNAFRIEKYRVAGKRQAEFSAWSPPRVGDFHHVARFGRMRFGGEARPVIRRIRTSVVAVSLVVSCGAVDTASNGPAARAPRRPAGPPRPPSPPIPWWRNTVPGVYRITPAVSPAQPGEVAVLGVGRSDDHQHPAEGFTVAKFGARLAVRRAAGTVAVPGPLPEPTMEDFYIAANGAFWALFRMPLPGNVELPKDVATWKRPAPADHAGRHRRGRHLFDGARHLYLECEIEGPIANPDWGQTRSWARLGAEPKP